jgi:hypothetical protein
MATSSLLQTTRARATVAQRLAPAPREKDQQTVEDLLIQTAGPADVPAAGMVSR